MHVGYLTNVKDCFTPGETQKTSTSSNGSSSSSGDWFASIFNYNKVYIFNFKHLNFVKFIKLNRKRVMVLIMVILMWMKTTWRKKKWIWMKLGA